MTYNIYWLEAKLQGLSDTQASQFAKTQIEKKEQYKQLFDNLPISTRHQNLKKGMRVHCFEKDIANQDSHIGIAEIEEIYDDNLCWCTNERPLINYSYYVIPL